MGWLFTQGQSRKCLVARRTETWHSADQKHESVCLAHCWRGNVTHAGRLWSVREVRHKDDAGAVTRAERFIALDLCEYQAGYGWGYKDLEESCGPCEVDCPEKYLAMVPEPAGEYGPAWRERVRAHHAERRAAAAIIRDARPGDVVELKPGCTPRLLTVKQVGKRHLVGSVDATGASYRIAARHVARNLGPAAEAVLEEG